MSADLAIGVKDGFSAGAAIAGLTSLGRSMDKLGAETQKLTARQRMLGNVLSDPGKMSKQRIGELKREYLQLGIAVDKRRYKHAHLLVSIRLGLRDVAINEYRYRKTGDIAQLNSMAKTAFGHDKPVSGSLWGFSCRY